MGSALEAALLAAMRVGSSTKQPAASTMSAQPAQPAAGAAKKQNKRKRRDRGNSIASHGSASDPVERIEQFKAKMFDVGTDAKPSVLSFAAKPADEIVKVQWKPKAKPAATEDADAVPQLTRPRVVTANGGTQPTATPTATNAKKKKKNRPGKKKPRVIELRAPESKPQTAEQAKPTAANVTGQHTQQQATREAQAKPLAPSTLMSTPVHQQRVPLKHKPAAANPPAPASAADAADVATTAEQIHVSIDTHSDIETSVEDTSGVEDTNEPADLNENARPSSVAVTTAVHEAPAPAPLVAKAEVQLKKRPAAKQQPIQPTTVVTSATKPKPVKANARTTTPPATAPPPTTRYLVAEEDVDRWDINALVKNTVKKAAKRARSGSVSDAESRDEDYTAGDGFKEYRLQLFSELIDEAAREQWELVEVGRLVRIFSAQWGRSPKKTARYLRRYCPELVSVDFLEGLNVAFSAKQLLKIFDRGSGSSVVLMNKIASAVENGNLSVHDADVQSHIADKTQRMATNMEIIEFLVPLLESLTTVKDVGALLHAICMHWHIDRTASLVQEILLTPVFDDLEGQSDEILAYFPQLEGRVDFPSCMDDEDADENGNLEGLIAGEESDLGESDAHSEDEAEEKLGEILSDDAEGDDSHAEDEVYDGETDSEEEEMMREMLNPTKPRRPSRFVLDEADEDDGDEDDGDDFIEDDEGGAADSSESSEDEETPSPTRKRLRRG